MDGFGTGAGSETTQGGSIEEPMPSLLGHVCLNLLERHVLCVDFTWSYAAHNPSD